MAFKRIEQYECSLCGKKWDTSRQHCSCEKNMSPGSILGSFRLINRQGRRWKVTCLLCGMECVIDYANIFKQKSCGCKPRHVFLLNVSEGYVRYRCDRCQENFVQTVPVLEWCCNDL